MLSEMFEIDRSTFGVPDAALSRLSPSSQAAVSRLLEQAPGTVDLSNYPNNKLAAVLVLLYEKAEQLRVLLTTRSPNLRSHPGQTALPGGRFDETDKTLIETAYREADEEVGLPRDSKDVHALCLLPPNISLHKLVVTPVVALLTDLSLLETLKPNPGEVVHIFDHPLEAILDPSLVANEKLAKKMSSDWPYTTEFHNTSDSEVLFLSGSMYRMHRFRSSASPVKGLTSDILIRVAEIAYDRPTTYERYAPNQLTTFSAIADALKQYEEKEKERLEKLIDEAEAASEVRRIALQKEKGKTTDVPNGNTEVLEDKNTSS